MIEVIDTEATITSTREAVDADVWHQRVTAARESILADLDVLQADVTVRLLKAYVLEADYWQRMKGSWIGGEATERRVKR